MMELRSQIASRLRSQTEKFATLAEQIESGVLSAQSLVYNYESTLQSGARKKSGSFFTPRDVVDQMVEELLGSGCFDARMLDPCCGSGAFLLGAFDYLLNRRPGDAELVAYATRVLGEVLYGIDKDGDALALAQAVLHLRFVEVVEESGETAANDLPKLHLKIGDSILGEGDEQEKFEFIIGNPPYGLSRDEKLSAEENRQIKQQYREFRFGKVNKYLAALAAGVKRLTPGGKLLYLVPNSWLGIKSGETFRKWLLTAGMLRRITPLPRSIFPDAAVEVVTVLVENSAKYSENVEIRDGIAGERENLFISPQSILASPAAILPIGQDAESLQLLSQIDLVSAPLVQMGFRPMIALQAYARGKGVPPQTAEVVKSHPFHTLTKEDADTFPYLEGRDITRYKINWSGKYLRWGPWLAEPQSLERFSGPRIVLREILGTPPYLFQCAYTEETILYNKSVLHILPGPTRSRIDLLALMIILNSALGSFVLATRGRKSRRTLFPKIVADDLKDFPIPHQFDTMKHHLAALAPQMPAAQPQANTLVRSLFSVVEPNPSLL